MLIKVSKEEKKDVTMRSETPQAVTVQLNVLLNDPGNLKCADCKLQSHPRWASWSLGVLICIKCAGIHRSMGTHISKVKSIDLDTWSEENLTKLLEGGNNERINSLLYEAKLPKETALKINLEDTAILTRFIRDKYELHKWLSSTPLLAADPVLNIVKPAPPSSPTDDLNNIESGNSSLVTLTSYNRETDGSLVNLKSVSSLQTSTKANENTDSPSKGKFIKRSIRDLYTNCM